MDHTITYPVIRGMALHFQIRPNGFRSVLHFILHTRVTKSPTYLTLHFLSDALKHNKKALLRLKMVLGVAA